MHRRCVLSSFATTSSQTCSLVWAALLRPDPEASPSLGLRLEGHSTPSVQHASFEIRSVHEIDSCARTTGGGSFACAPIGEQENAPTTRDVTVSNSMPWFSRKLGLFGSSLLSMPPLQPHALIRHANRAADSRADRRGTSRWRRAVRAESASCP
jgi:hypothetical protein